MSFSETSPSQVIATATDLLGPWFRTLARSVRTGVILLDAEGNPIFSNGAAKELLGLPASSEDGGLERLRDALPVGLHGAGAPGSAVVEVELDLPGGERRVLLRVVALESEDCGAVVLVEDRTKMVALEASLVLASRVQAGSHLRAHIHDLKGPLNGTGIGLTVARSLVEAQGGRMLLKSRPGDGTTVEIRPRARTS